MISANTTKQILRSDDNVTAAENYEIEVLTPEEKLAQLSGDIACDTCSVEHTTSIDKSVSNTDYFNMKGAPTC